MSETPSWLCLRWEPFGDGSGPRIIDGFEVRVRVRERLSVCVSVCEWVVVCFPRVAYSREGISETSVPRI